MRRSTSLSLEAKQMANRIAILLAAVTLGVLATGCDGGGLTPPPPPPEGPNITGNWQFSTASTVAGMPPTTIAGGITQSGSALTAAVHVDGSNCFDPVTTIDLAGTLADDNVSLTSTSVAGQVITITGNVTDSVLIGTYDIAGSCANGDEGNLAGLRVRPMTGTWRIIFEVNDQHVGIVRATLTQGSPGSEGSSGVTGTATNSIKVPSCYSGTVTAGTFPAASFIMGRSVVLEIESDDATVVFRGTANEDGTAIIGHHEVFGGPCNGYAGGGRLGRLTPDQ